MSKSPYKESNVDFIIGLVCTIGVVIAMLCMLALFVSWP